MPEEPAPDRIVPNLAPRPGETHADYRLRVALVQAEAHERRQQELREQRSPSKTPADRIRLWEQLHQLPLPRRLSHHLVTVIATDTGLSLDEVRCEQNVRAAATKVTPSTG
jgi:hypothetical protein